MTRNKWFLVAVSLTLFLIPQMLIPRASAYAPGSITVGGYDIPIAAHGYVGYSMDDDVQLYNAQRIIDSHQVASAVNPLSVTDGVTTHLMAHNPGIFSPIAHSIHNGAKYVITDFNGQSQVYEFYYVGQVEAYTELDYNGAIYNSIWGAGEAVTIQYCLDGTEVPQIWRGVVSQDQSLLNPVTTTPETTTAAVESPAPATNAEPKSKENPAPKETKQEPIKLSDNVKNPIRKLTEGDGMAKILAESVHSSLTNSLERAKIDKEVEDKSLFKHLKAFLSWITTGG